MMDLTLSQIAASRRTMSVYFLYDEKHCNIYYTAPPVPSDRYARDT